MIERLSALYLYGDAQIASDYIQIRNELGGFECSGPNSSAERTDARKCGEGTTEATSDWVDVIAGSYNCCRCRMFEGCTVFTAFDFSGDSPTTRLLRSHLGFGVFETIQQYHNQNTGLSISWFQKYRTGIRHLSN